MEEEKIVNQPHLTAIKRQTMSTPARWLKEHGLLQGDVLDFGCGYGKDVEVLEAEGVSIVGYDSYYHNVLPEKRFDTIMCVYVLNVLEPYPQAEVLMLVSNWLKPKGKAYFAVRRDLEKEGFRKNVRGGWTYQCNVVLPYKSIEKNSGFEIYEYQHWNQLPRKATGRGVCPFCNLARRVELICETATMVAFYDGYPVSPGHALIIPKRHVENYFDLTPKEQQAMQCVLMWVKQVVDARYHPDGYNIGVNCGTAAGQSIPHVHMHLIPRYKGDMENPKGGVRGVIPGKQKY